jgi:hypothetical protein
MYKLRCCENTGGRTEGIKGTKGLQEWKNVDEGSILV